MVFKTRLFWMWVREGRVSLCGAQVRFPHWLAVWVWALFKCNELSARSGEQCPHCGICLIPELGFPHTSQCTGKPRGRSVCGNEMLCSCVFCSSSPVLSEESHWMQLGHPSTWAWICLRKGGWKRQFPLPWGLEAPGDPWGRLRT